MRLLRIELRRAFARRLTKMVLVLSLAGIVAAGLSVYFTSARKTVHVTAHGPKIAGFVDACTKGEPLPIEETPPLPAVGSSGRASACQDLVDHLTGSVIDKRFYLTSLIDILKHVSAFAAIIAWLLGASYIGAEWRAGSFATLLTWEPRRMRVMVAKVIAAMVVSFGLVMILQAILVGALFPSALLHGSTAVTRCPPETSCLLFPAKAAFWRSLTYLGLRSGVLAAGAALMGFALGAIGRNTAASLGSGFFYIAIVEGSIIGNFVAKARPWLLVRNAIVFINNTRIEAVPSRTPLQAGLIVFGYAVGLFLIAALATRARDVN